MTILHFLLFDCFHIIELQSCHALNKNLNELILLVTNDKIDELKIHSQTEWASPWKSQNSDWTFHLLFVNTANKRGLNKVSQLLVWRWNYDIFVFIILEKFLSFLYQKQVFLY